MGWPSPCITTIRRCQRTPLLSGKVRARLDCVSPDPPLPLAALAGRERESVCVCLRVRATRNIAQKLKGQAPSAMLGGKRAPAATLQIDWIWMAWIGPESRSIHLLGSEESQSSIHLEISLMASVWLSLVEIDDMYGAWPTRWADRGGNGMHVQEHLPEMTGPSGAVKRALVE